MAPPSEKSVLSNFLLSPASLPTVMSLQKFTELFPKRLRSHPQIRALYRELQQLREQDMELINENIDEEVERGKEQRGELRKASRNRDVESLNENDQREMDIDMRLFGSEPALSSEDYHSLSSLLSEMEAACDDIEREIADVDEEADRILSGLNTTVDEMSDLRYGKHQGPAGQTADDVVDEAVQGLKNLEDSCHRNSTS
ncbi:hypothetical protein MPDQ_003697 [Monascus purpureus]|uniref:Uncharacterized protein n=1 Tax=Monascus purpureus TaxID=5098 RepID=A0A507QKY4_MONPU|nr:hypothetical protein MPDQ_003697 [Monascus purpureus]BDD58265.1 hypothetical protein MAP00_003559 [Monascus purpureus]